MRSIRPTSVNGPSGTRCEVSELTKLAPLAKSLQADYLVVDFPLTPEQIAAFPVDLVWQNDTFTLLKLH